MHVSASFCMRVCPDSRTLANCSLGLAARFYDFLSLEHPNNNVHNLRLCRLLAARGSQPAARLLQDGVTAKVRVYGLGLA